MIETTSSIPAPPDPLPCPFCGSVDLSAHLTWIGCKTCGASGPGPKQSEWHGAEHAWNRRAPTAVRKDDAFRVIELYRGWNVGQKSMSLALGGARELEDDIYDERRKLLAEALRVIQSVLTATAGQS